MAIQLENGLIIGRLTVGLGTFITWIIFYPILMTA